MLITHNTIENFYTSIYIKVSNLTNIWNAENKVEFNPLI
jgi:hypothetical protein